MTLQQRLAGLRRGELRAAAAVAGVVILIIATSVMIVVNERDYREAKLLQVDSQARILASTVAAALFFDDRKAGEEYVRALQVDSGIELAAVYDSRGGLFAGFSRPGAPAPPATGVRGPPLISGERLVLTAPVLQNDRVIGTVYLQSTFERMTRRLERYGLIAVLVATAALIFVILGITQATLTRGNAELKRRSDELAAANAQLHDQIMRREKAETELRQSQKMESLGQLTGGIAHDFNNLLQVIIGSLEALSRRSGPAGQEEQRIMAAAMRGAQRAATLTQRLLAFSRRQPLDPKPIDVNKLVAGMSEILHRTLGEAITIETVLSGGLWRIAADANQLENALLNLAVNARDAMPGGGKLTIETANSFLDETYAGAHEDVQPGQYVVIAVSDTGTGMTREVLEKAMEPFFTTKDIGKGSGLGLSQVYGFVKQSGGHVSLYSEPAAGTTVKLYMPRLIGGAEERDAVREAETVMPGSHAAVILFVEDEEDVRTHVAAMLRELGYTVLEASNGAMALRLLEAHPAIQLLFTDVGLPGSHNGRQLADEARRRHPGLPVLFTTGYARNAIVHQGRLDPGVELITKPFTLASLSARIHGILAAMSRQES